MLQFGDPISIVSTLILGTVVLFSFAPGLALSQNQTETDSRGDEKIGEFRQRVVDAMEARDSETYASLFTENATVMPRDGEPIDGRDAIEDWSTGLFSAYQPNISIESEEVRRLGRNWALDWGHYESTYEPVGGADPMVVDETYFWLLRRTETGEWRLARIIWNSNGSGEE